MFLKALEQLDLTVEKGLFIAGTTITSKLETQGQLQGPQQKHNISPSLHRRKLSVRTHPQGGSGGSRQFRPPNDTPDTAPTATADDSNDGRNIETEEIKQQTDIVFNYSNVKLSKAMQKLLNRALNFALLPFKLDITQLLVDFNRFARAMIWQEFWFERENNEEYEKPIFKSRKKNLPKNYSTPKGLKTMLSSIRSEIMDPRNRNKRTSKPSP